MKALSVHQPWAFAILHLAKNVENRSWYTPHRGPLLVHASKSLLSYNREDPEGWRDWYGVGFPAWNELITGAVVGVVNVTDCVRANPRLPYFLPGRGPNVWAEGPWCWLLENPRALPEPVPLRGSRLLFGVPDGLIPEAFR